jgi:hypothetical protein
MKKYTIYLGPVILGVGCLVTFLLIGSYVDETGILIEPFFLIPIGFFGFIMGSVFGLGRSLWALKKAPRLKIDKAMFAFFFVCILLVSFHVVSIP